MGMYKRYQNYQKHSEGESDSYYTSLYVRIKETIITRVDNLKKAYNEYYRVCVLKNKNSKKKFDDWVTAIIALYLELQQKLEKVNPETKEIIDIMDGILIKRKVLDYATAYKVHFFLLKWCEESGLTKISIERKDFMEELEDEEHEWV